VPPDHLLPDRLADQDRSLWDTAQIADGRAMLDRALALRGRGHHVMQAAIASLHADEPRDWPQIVALCGELARLTDSPVVELSRAVAVAEAGGGRRTLGRERPACQRDQRADRPGADQSDNDAPPEQEETDRREGEDRELPWLG